MPTYQYACTECGEHLEAVQSFSDPALTECPTCQGRLRKVFNSVGIVFKGSGFYRNDSRSNGASKENGTSENGTSENASTPAADKKPAEKKTESTPAAPAATASSSSTKTTSTAA